MARRSGSQSEGVSGALRALGMTPLEAEAYGFLVREGSSTGYRVAQAIGRPAGNMYKSLEAMEARGFVMSSDEEGGRLYRAVPVREVGGRVVREVERAAGRAARELERSGAISGEGAPDDRLYAIVERGAAMERARAMIAGASDFIVLSACPVFVDALREELEEAAARHVAVGIKTFGPGRVEGAHVVMDSRGESAWREGPGQWMSISADGREVLSVLLDHAGEHLETAHWSRNPLLNWQMYTGIATNILLAEVEALVAAGATGAEITRALGSLHRIQTPVSGGKSELHRRYRASSAAGKRGVRGKRSS